MVNGVHADINANYFQTYVQLDTTALDYTPTR